MYVHVMPGIYIHINRTGTGQECLIQIIDRRNVCNEHIFNGSSREF